MPDSANAHTTEAAESAHHGVLHLPVVSVPHVSVSHVPVPRLHLRMPTGTRGRLLWWGGLAAVAAAGVVDWPVAALVAAGSWVAEQSAKAGQESDRPHKADE
jgi:hypothetical protein